MTYRHERSYLKTGEAISRCVVFLFFSGFSVLHAVGNTSDPVAALQQGNVGERRAAVQQLLNLAPKAPEAIKALTDALNDPEDAEIRRLAATALGQIGAEATGAVDTLISKLTSSDPLDTHFKPTIGSPRQFAVYALGRIGPNAKAAVPRIIDILENDPLLRRTAAEALGNIGPEARLAIGPLIRILGAGDTLTNRVVAVSLGIIASNDPNPEATQTALIALLKKKDESLDTRYAAAIALARVGRVTRPVISALIEELDGDTSYMANAAAVALARIRPQDKDAVEALTNALRKNTVRHKAAEALGKIGAAATLAIGELIESYKIERDAQILDGMRIIADALGGIASSLQSSNDVDAIDRLTEAQQVLQSSPYGEVKKNVEQIQAGIAHLNDVKRDRIVGRAIGWIKGQPLLSTLIALYIILPLFCLIVLWRRPLLLLQINEALKPYTDFKLPDLLGGIRLPLRYILLVGFFHYDRRVLDAWVSKYADTARNRFRQNATVEEREGFVPIPVVREGENVASLEPKHLRSVFARRVGCVLICGEGGAGKTSLACQIARWAMSDDKGSRLCEQHLMLPVLIEQDLVFQVEGGSDPLFEAIHGQLKALIDEPYSVSQDLLDHLLRQQRVLVILDGLSEMNDTIRRMISPSARNFAANALVVTSRIEEKLGNLPKCTIKPLRIKGNRLSSFMEAYLTQRSKRELFDDPEYFEACRRLSLMVGDREITVLLAKLFAEQMISSKEYSAEVPENIPDLMLSYLNELNRAHIENRPEDPTVHLAAKVIAWECLKQTYQPKPAKRAEILASLNKESISPDLSTHLEKRLRIVQKIGPGGEYIRFSLDPLAEYLAALYLVDQNGDNKDLWKEFLQNLEDISEQSQKIRGFLLAVRDCCLARIGVPGIRDFLSSELASRAGLAG